MKIVVELKSHGDSSVEIQTHVEGLPPSFNEEWNAMAICEAIKMALRAIKEKAERVTDLTKEPNGEN